MVRQVEIEKTYLAKYIPDLRNCKCLDIHDIYLPESEPHPVLRVRKIGTDYEITKKVPVHGDEAVHVEHTIPLTAEEFDSFANISRNQLRKRRYLLTHNEKCIDIDVFLDNLSGLVLVDIEFENEAEKNSYSQPEFCLHDVTTEKFINGGELCSKSYKEIENELERFHYKKLLLPAELLESLD